MKSNHLAACLSVLILVFALSGCAGKSTRSASELSCTTVDINAMLNSGDYQRKADNFILIEDASSSMNKYEYKSKSSRSPSRLVISKGLIRCLNNTLPADFQVNGGMRIFGLKKSEDGLVYGMDRYSKDGLEQGVRAITGTGNRTDLSDAISDAATDLQQATGRNAVIIFSDGGVTGDIDPVAAAAEMKSIYGENVCIYTVLFGDDAQGMTTMQQIAAQGRCGFSTEAKNLYMKPLSECDTLNTGKGMGDFAARVFLEKPPKLPPPKPDIDSDGDGVLDSRDKCPDTPPGIEVDEFGCPLPFKETVRITLLVEFDFDKDAVKFPFHEDIQQVASFLQAYPEVVVELEGHTDHIGTEEYNMELSRRRAASVKKYLVENFGIDESRITTVGYGESMPVDTNETEEGRQRNRRVVAVIETEVEKK